METYMLGDEIVEVGGMKLHVMVSNRAKRNKEKYDKIIGELGIPTAIVRGDYMEVYPGCRDLLQAYGLAGDGLLVVREHYLEVVKSKKVTAVDNPLGQDGIMVPTKVARELGILGKDGA